MDDDSSSNLTSYLSENLDEELLIPAHDSGLYSYRRRKNYFDCQERNQRTTKGQIIKGFVNLNYYFRNKGKYFFLILSSSLFKDFFD